MLEALEALESLELLEKLEPLEKLDLLESLVADSKHADTSSVRNPFQIILQSALVSNHTFALTRSVEHVEFSIISPKSNTLVRIVQSRFLRHHRDDVAIVDSPQLLARKSCI